MGAAGIDISALSVSEVRRIIELAEVRGQTALASQLRAELGRRSAEAAQAWAAPLVEELPDELPDAPPPAPPRPAAATAPAPIPQRPATSLAPRPLATSPALPPARRRPVTSLGAVAFAISLGAAAASAWWWTSAGRPSGPRLAEALIAAVPALRSQPTGLAEAPTPPSRSAYRPSVCRAPATPGQRIICASPSLLADDHRMMQAYRRALAAGASRAVLDHDQARWRGARNALSSPQRIAELYRIRTAELDAAAGNAHRPAHSPGRHRRRQLPAP